MYVDNNFCSQTVSSQTYTPAKPIDLEQFEKGYNNKVVRNFFATYAWSDLNTFHEKKILFNQYYTAYKQVPPEMPAYDVIEVFYNIFNINYLENIKKDGQHSSKELSKNIDLQSLSTIKTPTLLPKELWRHIFSFICFTSHQEICQFRTTCKGFAAVFLDRQYLNHLFASGFPLALTHVTDQKLEAIKDKGEQLIALSLQGNDFTPEKLADMLQSCPDLQSIEFRQCYSEKFDDYISVLSLYAFKLRHLKIVDCVLITNKSLLTLGAHLANQLQSFELTTHYANLTIGDRGLLPFLKRCRALTSLKITGYAKVRSLSILGFIGAPQPNLEELTFSYNGGIDRVLFDNIAKNCPNLKKLEVLSNPFLSDELSDLDPLTIFKEISSKCNNLTSINLFSVN